MFNFLFLCFLLELITIRIRCYSVRRLYCLMIICFYGNLVDLRCEQFMCFIPESFLRFQFYFIIFQTLVTIFNFISCLIILIFVPFTFLSMHALFMIQLKILGIKTTSFFIIFPPNSSLITPITFLFLAYQLQSVKFIVRFIKFVPTYSARSDFKWTSNFKQTLKLSVSVKTTFPFFPIFVLHNYTKNSYITVLLRLINLKKQAYSLIMEFFSFALLINFLRKALQYNNWF